MIRNDLSTNLPVLTENSYGMQPKTDNLSLADVYEVIIRLMQQIVIQ